MINTQQLYLTLIVVLGTFDSIVLPYIRLSIADISIFTIIFSLGLTKRVIFQATKSVFLVTLTLVAINSIVYLLHIVLNAERFEVGLVFTGFLRPAMFLFLAMSLYLSLKSNNIDLYNLHKGLSIGGALLSGIVFLQFIGYWPGQFHNNPSFGESGRWTLFSEGWRPTGLTNEASFVGIYLVLLLSLQLYINKNAKFTKSTFLLYAPYITLMGCFFTTSRISLLIGLIAIFVYASFRSKLIIAAIALVLLVFFEGIVPSRILDIASFDGDASTIERYGSTLAYVNAIFAGDYILGTGYLNGSNVAMRFAEPAVIQILDERDLPAFSLPLQILLEFGLPFFSIILILALIKYKVTLIPPLLFVYLTSLVTGIQNFVFVYIFISIAIYAKYSLHK